MYNYNHVRIAKTANRSLYRDTVHKLFNGLMSLFFRDIQVLKEQLLELLAGAVCVHVCSHVIRQHLQWSRNHLQYFVRD